VFWGAEWNEASWVVFRLTVLQGGPEFFNTQRALWEKRFKFDWAARDIVYGAFEKYLKKLRKKAEQKR
jgi:hypothetical protein